jgi:hypothetical protein
MTFALAALRTGNIGLVLPRSISDAASPDHCFDLVGLRGGEIIDGG